MLSSQLKIPSGLSIALHQDPCYTPLPTLFNKPYNYFASKMAQVSPWQVSIATLFNSQCCWHCYFNCCYVQMAQCYHGQVFGSFHLSAGTQCMSKIRRTGLRCWIWNFRYGSCEHLERSALLTGQAKLTNAMESYAGFFFFFFKRSTKIHTPNVTQCNGSDNEMTSIPLYVWIRGLWWHTGVWP